MSYQKKELNVIWQDKVTRSCFHIGTLSYDQETYVFNYHRDASSFKEALEHGYKPHPLFPDINKMYTSRELFIAFDRRIPSKNRQDYSMILNDFGLNEDAEKMDILKATRGKIANDTYSLEEPIIQNENHEIQTSFYIQGMRHQNHLDQFEKKINYDTTLVLKKEPENPHDPWAIGIYTKHDTKLGYVPRYYSKFISLLMDVDTKIDLRIVYINERSTPHWWVKVHLCAPLPKANQTVLEKLLI